MGLTSTRSRTAVIASAVLALVLTAAACSDAASTTTTAAAAPPTAAAKQLQIDISGFAFGQTDMTVAAGTAVTWMNLDGVPHTITADDGAWDSGNVADGASFSFTLDTPGTYAYHCSIHPSMKATITVEG